MSDNEFLDLVARMRNMQKEYSSDAEQCRALERKVDAEIDRRQRWRLW